MQKSLYMPSKRPRTPEVEVAEDPESGFIVNIYDGEHLIQVRPHDNGYQLSLASKTGMGDAGYLRTYDRQEWYRRRLETEYEGIDVDAVFEVLDEHFDRHYFSTWFKKEKDWNRELVKYMRGDSIKGKDGDSLDDYVHPYFEDIHEQYLEEIYKFGLR